MSLLCACPVGAELPDVTIDPCFENTGQIQKLIFQRNYNGAARNAIVVANDDPTLLATWTALLAAADSTKVVPSPFINNPEFEAGEARPFGGGNATIGGIEIILGANPTTFTSSLLRTSFVTIRELKAFRCEDLGVYMIDEFGRILADSDGLATPLEYYPIPISGLFIGDRDIGGFEEPDSNMLNFSLFSNWDNNISRIVPTDFNALREIVSP